MFDYEKDIVNLLRNCDHKNKGTIEAISLEDEAADIIEGWRRRYLRMRSQMDLLEGFRAGVMEAARIRDIPIEERPIEEREKEE